MSDRTKIALITLVLLSMSSALPAQPSDDPFNPDRDAYFKGEARRHALLLKATQEPASDQNIDATYYKLDLTITTSPKYLRGIVTAKARSLVHNLTSVTLDLRNSLTVDSVKSGAATLAFAQQPATLAITLDRTYGNGELVTLDIYYRGEPSSSGLGSFTFTTHAGLPWVYTLSEPYGARDWWPCKDHPLDKADSVDIWITVDSTLKVGSNGKLVGVSANGTGTKTYKWAERYPISTYLVSLAIANYAEFTNWWRYAPADSMPVLNYVLPEHLGNAQATLPATVEMLRIYSALFGLYPFVNEKYGHAEFGWGGGMEHQTMTSLGGFSESLVAHELAHQWFGDMITCANWSNIWMNEGFATYGVALYNEARFGVPSYQAYMNSQMNSAVNAPGSIYVTDTLNLGTLFSGSLVYAKGATVLHMLRHVLGDSVLFRAIRTYADDARFRFGIASTEDFRQVCETVSGQQLGYFFDEWIYGRSYPHYTYSWKSVPDTNGGFIVSIRIRQSGTVTPAFFTMPVDFRLSGSGLDTTVVLLNNLADQTFLVHVPLFPATGQLDPNNWILKTATLVSVPNGEIAQIPGTFSLEQNYPNPFNPTTTVRFTIGGAVATIASDACPGRNEGGPAAAHVRLSVYDMLGREVAMLVNERKDPGNYSVTWDAGGTASGVYFYRMTTGDHIESRSMLLLR